MKKGPENTIQLQQEIKKLNDELNAIRSSKLSFSKKSINDSELINILDYACKYALLGKTWKSNLEKIIALIGEFLEVSSISILENNKKVFNQIIAWSNSEHKSNLDDETITALDLSKPSFSKFYNILNNNSSIKSTSEEFFTRYKPLISSAEIKGLAIIPIIIDDNFWGIIRIDDTNASRFWTKSEIDLFHYLMDLIRSSLKRSILDSDTVERNEILEKYYQSTPMALVLCREDGTVIEVNKYFEQLFKYDSSEVRGKNIDKIISPIDTKHEAENITKTVGAGKIIEIESIRRPKSGLPLYVSLTGVPIRLDNGQQYIIGIYKNITQRKMAEKQLNESQVKYKTLFANSPDGIILLKHDIIIDCNEQTLKLFNCGRHQFIGESILKFSPLLQEDGAISEKGVTKNILKTLDGQPQRFEWLHMTAQGKVFSSEVILNKVEIEDNIYIQSIVRNISERKANEKELLVAKQKAEESDKLKTAFLAHMSHEIRTPLNHILGSIDLITDDDMPSDTKDEFKQIVKNSSDDLLRLINNIIDLAMIESDQMEVNKVDTLISDLITTTQKHFNKCIQKQQKEYLNFKTSIPSHLTNSKINVDPDRFDQIIHSLVDNAVKFTNKGFVELGCDLKNDFFTFFIKDTGIGIEKDKFSVIFDRFRQVDYTHTREFGGTGLGLAISKEIIEHMGGTIWVDSELKMGSTFYFTIPSSGKTEILESSSQDTVSTTLAYNWNGKTILIIEDEEVNIQYLKTVLDRTNVTILVAQDGQTGLELIKTQEINLVLMDIQLPIMDGYEATKLIKAHNQNIKVIAQTAHALKEDKEKCLAAGCDDYMSKPLKRTLLLEMIDKLIMTK